VSGVTTIEWADATWNPVTGCAKVSPGCAHCYAEAFAERFRGVPGHPYEQGFDLRLWPERLEVPLRWRKPRRIFVNSMSDLFHEAVPDGFVADVFAVMDRARQHTFLVLTKRPERLVDLAPHLPWPANVWMGVSIENRHYVGRAELLRRVPAAVRFISAEPLLGPLDGLDLAGIDLLIVGGESGPRARPMDLAWARDLVARCRAAGVAVFVKQMGSAWAGRGKGADLAAWPADLRVREMPPSERAADCSEPELMMARDAITGELVHVHQFDGHDWCVECGWPFGEPVFRW
jgi:protein gp37